MSRIEEFEELRPLLFSIAHRIVGSDSAAEDALHETWLRYEAAPAVPVAAREYLSALVTRVSADVVRSARTGRDRYRRPGGGEPLLTRQDLRGPRYPGRPAPPGESPSTAAVLLLERLPPPERAVYVLWEVFGCGVAEIASAVGCSEAAACGRLAAVVARTREDDGETPPWPGLIVGADQVARALSAIGPALSGIGVTMRPQAVQSRPGAVFRDREGRVLSALTLDFLDGRIQTVRWVDPLEAGAVDAAPDVTP